MGHCRVHGRYGFRPVNPNMATFEGDRCYPDLRSIPGGVDGVVIVTRPETTARIVRDCGAAGISRVWMHQSMAKGSSVSPEAVDYCRQHGSSDVCSSDLCRSTSPGPAARRS